MEFKKGINKCVECEKKMKDPDETGMCSKCGAAETRIEKIMSKELIDEGRVNPNVDRKHLWFKDLKDDNDGKMIDSIPINLNYFINKQM